MADISVEDPKKALAALGFEKAGEWKSADGVLRYQLERHENASHLLYAFFVGDKVCYIGKSVRTLKKRMDGYRNPGSTQLTNQAIHSELEKQSVVEIWALVVREKIFYKGWPLNIAAGLEDVLIARLSPAWNKAGITNPILAAVNGEGKQDETNGAL